MLLTDCPNSGEIVQNGACICANTFETVQNGACVCPAGQIVQNGACAGKAIFSVDSNLNLTAGPGLSDTEFLSENLGF